MRKRAAELRSYFLLDINIVIRFLIISDIVLSGAIGLLGPIFALFIVDFIQGGNAAVAGIATTIYLITKSIFQIPAATIVDKIRGEKDDFGILFIGTLLGALIPLAYLFIATPTGLYIVQFFYGLIIAFTFPSYMAIFTRHIDAHKEGTEWGVYFTLTDFTYAITAGIGGVIAETVGFHSLIIGVAAVSVVGAFLLYLVRPYILNARGKPYKQ